MKIQRKRRERVRKCELLRAIEMQLFIEQLNEAICRFSGYCLQRQNRLTAIKLEKRRML